MEPEEASSRRRIAADRARHTERRALIKRMAQRQAERPPRRSAASQSGLGDDDIVARSDWARLLEAVADGRVRRGAGEETSMFAPYLLDGDEVRTPLLTLARLELIRMPISGRPELLPHGERIVARIKQQRHLRD